MLSPFRGLMHCVETEWADAVTTDGREWTLYVRGECLYDDPEVVREQAISVPDIKYGTWSRAFGFQRAPIRLPTFEARVRAAGDALLGAVQQHAEALPFPLADRYELWLLHGDTGRPLALIASACRLSERETPNLLRWTPGQRCLAEQPAARALVTRVAELAGREPTAQWFERRPDGSGVPCVEVGDDTPPVAIRSSDFGGFQIDESALDDAQIDLLREIEDWQAPSLLQLPDLPPAARRALEIAACRHAVRLAEQLPLYPCVLDRAAITAALVEARMRQSQTGVVTTDGGERALSPYYLEMADD